jgi:hypothetical protein
VNYGWIDAWDGTVATDTAASLVNNGRIDTASLFNNGDLGGSGIMGGDFTNYLRFTPGDPLGGMTIEGDYDEYRILNILLVETDDSIPRHGYVDVHGDVTLEEPSVLELEFSADFGENDLTSGDYFDVIRYTGALSGEFGEIDDTDAPLTSGLWSLTYDSELGEGVASVRLIYVATTLDRDEDGIPDASDNCPNVANPDQHDTDANGIGNACQCGDVNGDGFTNVSDALKIARGQVGTEDPNFGKCDCDGNTFCNVSDALMIARGQQGSAFEDQLCPAYHGE